MSAMIVAAAIGAGVSLYSANKNAKAGKDAAAAQERMTAADLAFRREQYDRYLGLYGDTEAKLAAQAESDRPLDYDQMQAQIETNAGNAERDLATNMAHRGFAGSGQDLAGMRGLAMGKASAKTAAWSQGLTNRRNLGLALTGRDQIGRAASGVSGGMQGMANLYGNQANLYNGAAGAGWNAFGQNLGNLAKAWDAYRQDNQPAAVTNVPSMPTDPQSPLVSRSNMSNGFDPFNPMSDPYSNFGNTAPSYDWGGNSFDPWSTGDNIY